MTVRFITNSSFGLGGLLGGAGEMGLERRSEDFGQTLGRWGVPAGPYLVLPFLGASSVRDTAGLRVDRVVGLPARVSPAPTRLARTPVGVVQSPTELPHASHLLGSVARYRVPLRGPGRRALSMARGAAHCPWPGAPRPNAQGGTATENAGAPRPKTQGHQNTQGGQVPRHDGAPRPKTQGRRDKRSQSSTEARAP